MLLLLFLLVFQVKSIKYESYEDISFEELEKNPELKSKIFMELIGAQKDECLPSLSETKEILKEKYGLEIEESKITNNLRFIAGKCNPVILVPGMLSVRTRFKIDCDNLQKKEKDIYRKMRLFCRFDDVCPSLNLRQYYENEFFLNIIGRFGFSVPYGCTNTQDDSYTLTCQNIYNACFSYFLNIFNGDECAKYSSGKSVCTKSDYIKILFYGGTPKTYKKSKCGTNAVKNIMSEIDVKTSRVYGDIIELFKEIGYNFGFSLGAIPNDFRKFVATNKFATDAFRYLIETFYANTGKKVIIIAHSFGNLITLHNLIAKENQDLIPKIKKFISIGPPFAGATKLLNAYLHDLKDFNVFPVTNFFTFGQSLLFKSAPVLAELKPLPIFSKLNKQEKYSNFVKAIKERINLEKCLIKNNCEEKVDSNEFDNLFKSYYPSLNSTICQENNSAENKYQKKCFLNLFNIFEKPMVIVVDDPKKIDEDSFDTDNYCNSNLDKCYYTNEMNEDKKSIEELFTKRKFVYSMKEMDNLLSIYRENQLEYGLLFDNLNKKDFETEEELKQANLLQFEHQKKNSLIKDLPIPPVDTDIIYSSVSETNTGEFLTSNVLKEGKIFSSGGDGTVSTWSSVLVGLKWIYDKKVNNLNQKIRLVEYCSKLSKDFPYNESSNFIALGCDCLKDKTYSKLEECGHQQMLFDTNLLSYLKQVAEIEEEITDDRIKAAKAVLDEPKKEYEMLCNEKLKDLADPKKNSSSSFIEINIIFIVISIIFLYF